MNRPLARPLDRAEAFFWFLDRCSSMNFAVMAEGFGPLQAAQLEAALDRAQAVHPALSVAIEADAAGRLAFVPHPGRRVALSREDAGADWRSAFAALLVQPFAAGQAPLLRAHWFERTDGRWAFAVVFHHAIGDGRSGFRLVTDLIDDARGVRTTPAHHVPRPSLMALFPEDLAGSAGLARAQEWKAALRGGTLRPGPFPGFTRDGGPVRPGIVAVHFDADVVAGLSRRAREIGASVHGLIGAAELIAARNCFGAGETPALMLTSPVDLRGNLAAPVDDATPGFFVTLLSSIATVGGPEDLPRLAIFLTDDLRRQVAEGRGHLFYHLVPPAETIPATAEGIAGFAAYMQRMPTAFVLSNVGRVAALPEANGVRVDEVSFALCPMAHQPLFVAASTWGGRLTLNVVHDAARFAPRAAQEIAAGIAAQLRQAAG
ncbi:MAG TPA: condensation domain-containing protein [Usitatibacteraceae bacterium]|nr:condensation domain-containing protein [Usitatibacteraceae bacterium]